MENEKKVRGEREVVESAPQLRRHLRTPLRGENKYQYAVKGDGAERDGHPETKTSRRRQLRNMANGTSASTTLIFKKSSKKKVEK